MKTGDLEPAFEMPAFIEMWRNAQDGLMWLPDPGIGYLPRFTPEIYGTGYFARYQQMAETAMGEALTRARVDFVSSFYEGPLVDFGIGAGQFVEAFPTPQCRGFDINPEAIDWLQRRHLWCDPWSEPVRALCFFDSLEHIPDPEPLLANVREWVFVSIPIVPDGEIPGPGWRHYRPGEHLLYVTRLGLLALMERFGFECVGRDDFETRLGRLDIETFAFRRKA